MSLFVNSFVNPVAEIFGYNFVAKDGGNKRKDVVSQAFEREDTFFGKVAVLIDLAWNITNIYG